MSLPNLDDPLDQIIADHWKADQDGAIAKANVVMLAGIQAANVTEDSTKDNIFLKMSIFSFLSN